MEAASTLADTLLDDLDDLSDVEETSPQDRFDRDDDDDDDGNDNGNGNGNGTSESHKAGDMEHAALLLQRQEGEDNDAYDSRIANSVPPTKKRLLDDKYLNRHLNTIRIMDSAESKTSGNATKEQQEDEHQLIVQSNKHLSNLADELAQAHRDLCATYKAKFPELEELLPNPVQYKNAVRVIGNEMDMTKINDALMEFLNNNQIITISVAGSTTSGRLLTTRELEQVDDAATYIENIIQVQNELAEFVEHRMESLAPSICALVGAATAARLIGLAGGLAELTKIPACNLQVLGQVKQNAASRAGLSSISTSRHQGVLMDCDLVKECPKHLQKKALKTVAAKLALSARCDFVNVDTGRTRSAQTGRKFRDDIEAKFHKWLEPDKAQTLKSLPKPDLTIKKRRGGKRMRRLKERFEETAMMKQANTRAFSEQAGEYGDDAMGLTRGLLDTSGVAKNAEKRKMKQFDNKASRKRAAQMNAGTTKSGLESSVVFTPVQGMELVNPDANKDRLREANSKWFSDSAGFQSALPKK